MKLILLIKVIPAFLCLTFAKLKEKNEIDITAQGVFNSCNYSQDLIYTAEENNLSPFLLAALIFQESRWQTNLQSNVGACGLTQVIGKYFGISCDFLKKNPALSIETGAHIINLYLEHTKNDLDKALACYSTGYKCSYMSYSKRVKQRSKQLQTTYNSILMEIHK
jgi:soluble lytic murein transglycosylase-like protein